MQTEATLKKTKRVYQMILIAVLMLLFFQWFINQELLKEQDGYSRLINISGKQRMYSQKITKSLLLLNQEKQILQNKINELKKDLSQWEKVGLKLKNGFLDNDQPYVLKNNAEKLLSEAFIIQQKLITCSDIVEKNIASQKQKLNIPYLNEILKLENSFLLLMDEVTLIFERELSQKQNNFDWLQHIFLFIIILFLLILFLGVLFPNIQKVFKLVKKFEQLSKTKDLLFSIIAHDLKGPIGTISQGFNYIIKENKNIPSQTQMDLFQNMNQSLSQTYNLLLNLLQWAKSQTENISVNQKIIEMSQFVPESVNVLQHFAKEKNIKIQYDSIQGICFADPDMLATVLRNLVSNSLKFTKRGGWVRISTEPEGNYLMITIEDNGVGIKSEHLSKLFHLEKHFTQPGTEEEIGSGLGLLLCKDFIERNHGTITLESEYQKGTKFFIHLPVK